ncbi:MAG: hypothetical protein ACP5PQ_06770 [Thermoproteota archaeon]
MKYEEFKSLVADVLKDHPLGLTFREIKALAGISVGRVPGAWVARLYRENVVRLERRGAVTVWVPVRGQRE